MFVFGAIIWFENDSHALTIFFKAQAVQDVIYLLMNHAFTFDNLLGTAYILLDYLGLYLDLLSLHY